MTEEIKTISSKHKLLADHYILTFNATASAIHAGYSPKTAYSSGSRVLKRVEVQEYINEQIENLAMGYRERLLKLAHIGRKGEKDSDQLKAIELLGRLDQDYTQKIDMTSNGETVGVQIYLPDNGRE